MLFFNQLTKDTKHEREMLYQTPQIIDALRGDISQATYIAYLEQAYHHVKHTVPLMMAAGSRLSEKNEFLREALVEYAKDEVGHQKWVLNDIRSVDPEMVILGQPKPATEMMIAYAYDYITRINPAGFFGMVFVLESTSTAMGTNAANTIQKSLNLPSSCFSYLSSHGSLDIEHMKFFKQLMNKISDKYDQKAITHMAKRMFFLYSNVFRSIPHKGMEVNYAA